MATNNPLLANVEYYQNCGVCNNSFELSAHVLYQCTQAECADDDRVYCRECIEFLHQRKTSHVLKLSEEGVPQHPSTDPNEITEQEGKADEKENKFEDIELTNPDEEQKNTEIELQIKEIQCECCDQKYHANEVFVCRHIDCGNLKDCKILCQDCGTLLHKKKKEKRHSFDLSQPYVKRVSHLLVPDQEKFDAAKFRANKIVSIATVERLLYQHRWVFTLPSSLFNFGAQVGASVAVTGTLPNIAACGAGNSVIGHAIGVTALGGLIGVGVSTFVEGIFIWRQYHLERISLEQAIGLTAVSLISNVASAGGFLGGMAIGAMIGTPIAPGIGTSIGAVIGGIIGALLLGIGSRIGLNKGIEYWYKHKNEARTEIQKQALLFFFGDEFEQDDIFDEKKFNAKIVRDTYRQLALLHHPDAPKNINISEKEKEKVNERWLQLSAYYGVLTGILDKMSKADEMIQGKDDLNEEQRSMITNEAIKNNLFVN